MKHTLVITKTAVEPSIEYKSIDWIRSFYLEFNLAA